MWEQYGENHAGVCIAFHRQGALSHILDDLHARGPFEHGEVLYTPRGFSDTPASALQLDQFDRGDLASSVASFIVTHEHELFFRKTLDWQSEHEYRVTLVTDADEGDYIFVPFGGAKSVQAVILGENFPEWQFSAAKWACDQAGVELLKMQWLVGMPWPMPSD